MNTIKLLKSTTDNGYYPDLRQLNHYPSVSIVTPTYERDDIFDLAIFNWKNFIYDKDKIEWIILNDSSRESIKRLKKKLPKDPRIKHYSCKKIDRIGIKRNKTVQLATGEIIVHMDDDDYYPPDSVINRVQGLVNYGKQCIGCSWVNCINLLDNTCFRTHGGIHGNTIIVAEASFAYYKSFWESQKFDETTTCEECKEFLENRDDDYIDLHTAFVMIAITHSKNMSDRVLKNSINVANFFESLPVAVTNILDDMQLVVHSKLPGMEETKEFIRSNKDKDLSIIMKKFEKLPYHVQSNSLMVCFMEDISPREIIKEKAVYVLYFPAQIYRNIHPFSKETTNYKVEQLIKTLEDNYKNKNVTVFANITSSFKIDSLDFKPWFMFNKKKAAYKLVIVDDHSHLDNIEIGNFKELDFVNLSADKTAYSNNILDRVSNYYTFGDIQDIYKLNHSDISGTKELKYYYLGEGKELKNNKVYVEDIELEEELTDYDSIHTYHYATVKPESKIQKSVTIDCEYYIMNNINLPLMCYLIKLGIKYLLKTTLPEAEYYGILTHKDKLPDDYYTILATKLKKSLT